VSTDSGHDYAVQMSTHFLHCACMAYNEPIPNPKLIDACVTWSVGDFTIMLNGRTDEVMFAGTSWQITVNRKGNITINGQLSGSYPDGTIAVRQRELLAVVIGACTLSQELPKGKSDVRVYESEPSGREISPPDL
jgi:hypothetical protein